jgi:hypothetical protein
MISGSIVYFFGRGMRIVEMKPYGCFVESAEGEVPTLCKLPCPSIISAVVASNRDKIQEDIRYKQGFD